MTSPIRLLHVHSGNLYGGIERVLATLRRFEPGSGLANRYALAFEGRLARELGDALAGLVGQVRRRFPWTVQKAQRRLRELLAAAPPDAVMVHGGWAQALLGGALADTGIPLTRWFHGAPAPDDDWERRAAEVAPALAVCNSRFTAQAAAPFIRGLPAHVVYPPVPPPPLAPDAARARLRTHAHAGPTTTVILHVARLESGKGHGVLIDALAGMPAGLDWQLWLVGGPQRPAEQRYLRGLERQVRRAGLGPRIHFLGERHDTSALYAAADVYCQPNTAPDAFGLTFVEALHAGLPVVTSALGGAIEIVTESCGVLVPPGDGPALTAALEPLMRDPGKRAALSVPGPSRAAELCDPARQIHHLAQCLATVVRSRAAG